MVMVARRSSTLPFCHKLVSCSFVSGLKRGL
jgi:hypothetical protein